MTVEELVEGAQTGDLVLFNSGNRKTQVGSMTPWTHVALILRPSSSAAPQVFECVEYKWVPGPESGGPQVVDLKEKIATYDVGGKFAYRPLSGVTEKGRKRMARKLQAFIDDFADVPYQKKVSELAQAGLELPGFDPKEETLDDLFCSEAVAEAMQRMGILSQDKPSNNYCPGDFSSNRWRPGDQIEPIVGEYGKEIVVVRDENQKRIRKAEKKRKAAQEEWAAEYAYQSTADDTTTGSTDDDDTSY